MHFVADPKTLYRRFGELVRQHRLDAALTQEEVGKRVGLSRTSITNIEKGRQRVLLHQLYELAAAILATPDMLLPELIQTDRLGEIEHKLRAASLRATKDTTEDERDWIERVIQSPSKS